jgi:CspA family cold shock protein
MPKGIVVSFERNSGFGFIETEHGERVFVHHTEIADAGRKYLVAGQQVEFIVKQTDRGPRAEAVTVLQEVPRKSERKLDWRHRRGGHPRSGDSPTRPWTAGEPEPEGEEGVLRAKPPRGGSPAGG